MKNKKTAPLKVTVALALLAAISIIAGKYLAIRGGDILRFSFENLPIIFAGVAFGPVAGALVGVVADIVGCVLVGYAINPLVTIGAASMGIVSGTVWLLAKKAVAIPLWAKISLTVAISHIIGSVLIKTYGLSQFYSMPILVLMLYRLINYIIVGAAEGAILFVLMKNKMLTAQIDSIKKGN